MAVVLLFAIGEFFCLRASDHYLAVYTRGPFPMWTLALAD